MLWSRIRDRVSDWLWSRLRSYWLAWSLTSVFYTGLWSRSPWSRSRSRRPSVITTSTSSWRRGCRFDLVVVSTLSSRRRYNVTICLSSGTSSSTTMTDDTYDVCRRTSVVGRPTLSSFTVCRHNRLEIRHIVRGHTITISMSRRVYLGPLSVPATGYGYRGIHVCLGNFVTFVPASLSRRKCPGHLCPPSCPGGLEII